MSRFDCILFDCDGVLVDSELPTNEVLRDMVNELSADAGTQISTEDSMRIFMGHSISDEYSQSEIKKLTGKTAPSDFYANFLRRRDDALRLHVKAIPHVADVLPALTLPFAVASGAEVAKMHLTLGQTGLLQHFGEGRMFGKDMVAKSKPAPDVYLLAAKTLGFRPERCLVVEDTTTGTTAGVAAGMTVFGFCFHNAPLPLLHAGAVAVFNDMRQLPRILGL
jgi:HAD superfamily hydrolase (TIGR01509 family)